MCDLICDVITCALEDARR